MKNAIDQVYSTFLPKGNHPFVYMDLQIEPKNVDVNMHPTKHEVNFLYGDEIVGKIKAAFESKLIGCNETKELYTQQLLPGASNPSLDASDQLSSQEKEEKEEKVYAKDKIRSDFKEQKLEKFFGKGYIKDSSDITETAITKIGDNWQPFENSPMVPTRTNSYIERK